jgi:hypothetical protein
MREDTPAQRFELSGIAKEGGLLHGHTVEQILKHRRIAVEGSHVPIHGQVMGLRSLVHAALEPVTEAGIQSQANALRQDARRIRERLLAHAALASSAARTA